MSVNLHLNILGLQGIVNKAQRMIHSSLANSKDGDSSPHMSHGQLDFNSVLSGVLVVFVLALLFLLTCTSIVSGEAKANTMAITIFTFASYVFASISFFILKGKTTFTNSKFILVWGCILVQLALTQVISEICNRGGMHGDQLLLLLLPYLLAPMAVTVLLGRRMGLFTVFVVSLLGCVLVPTRDILAALSISLVAGGITVITSSQVRSRSQLLKSGSYVGLSVLTMGILFSKVVLGGWEWMNLSLMIKEIFVAFGTSLFLAILLSGIFPVLEGAFKIVTPTGWLEKSDLNHPLLRRLQYEAPGTFHHSLVLAQLAEAAAQAIGANAFQCRVCAYFHDIGKLERPEYFTENMLSKDNSPHNDLAAASSATILRDHVDNGVELARKYKLEKRIIDTIQQHHGTSYVSFLYQKALDERDKALERVAAGLADESEVTYPNISQFTYSGPTPQSREVGIISLADAVESASRSLVNPTVEDIGNLVDSIIRHRIFDGQLDKSNLTLGDLQAIRGSFVSTIKNMMHTRISYPKDQTDEQVEQMAKQSKERPVQKNEDKKG